LDYVQYFPWFNLNVSGSLWTHFGETIISYLSQLKDLEKLEKVEKPAKKSHVQTC